MKRRIFTFVILGLVMALCTGAVSTAKAEQLPQNIPQAGAPTVVSYQGQVIINNVPYTGTGYFKFALIDGTTTYWTNDGTASGQPAAAVALSVSNGLFNVLLGDITIPNMVALPAAAFSGTSRSLRVWFSSDNASFTQLSPDQRVASVPYALQAEDANTLDGLHASSFASSAHDHWGQTWTGTGTGLTLSSTGYGIRAFGDTAGLIGRTQCTDCTGKGVYGVADAPNSIGGYFWNTSPTGSAIAALGYNSSSEGIAAFFLSEASTVTTNTAAVYARNHANNGLIPGYALAGHAFSNGTGVGAWSYNGRLFEGWSGDFPGGSLRFYVDNSGNVYADGTYSVFSTSRLDGAAHATTGLQATQVWLEDFGRAALENGAAVVAIAPDFAGLADLSAEYHVFLTPEGDSQGLYVTNLTATTFEVREQNGGKSSIPFSYRIVARPFDAESVRLPAVDAATLVRQAPERPAEGEP